LSQANTGIIGIGHKTEKRRIKHLDIESEQRGKLEQSWHQKQLRAQPVGDALDRNPMPLAPYHVRSVVDIVGFDATQRR
jgi:hypothetical protein